MTPLTWLTCSLTKKQFSSMSMETAYEGMSTDSILMKTLAPNQDERQLLSVSVQQPTFQERLRTIQTEDPLYCGRSEEEFFRSQHCIAVTRLLWMNTGGYYNSALVTISDLCSTIHVQQYETVVTSMSPQHTPAVFSRYGCQ